jgi:hypothetical protein
MLSLHLSGKERAKEEKEDQKTFLSTAERTGSPVFHSLWSNVKEMLTI